MKFLKWLFSIFVIDSLIILLIWNVIISTMFNCGKITFVVAVAVSVITNIIHAGIKSNDEYI
jgi:hypothetical protein